MKLLLLIIGLGLFASCNDAGWDQTPIPKDIDTTKNDTIVIKTDTIL